MSNYPVSEQVAYMVAKRFWATSYVDAIDRAYEGGIEEENVSIPYDHPADFQATVRELLQAVSDEHNIDLSKSCLEYAEIWESQAKASKDLRGDDQWAYYVAMCSLGHGVYWSDDLPLGDEPLHFHGFAILENLHSECYIGIDNNGDYDGHSIYLTYKVRGDDGGLNEGAKRAYVDDPTRCPFCESRQVQGGSTDFEANIATMSVSCSGCGKDWTDVYTLTNVSPN